MMKSACGFILTLLLIGPAAGQHNDANYDEVKVPKYTLPDPLVMASGERVSSPKDWRTRRRAEILRLFESNVYGRSPGRPEDMIFELTSIEKKALNGKAVRKEVSVYFSDRKNG